MRRNLGWLMAVFGIGAGTAALGCGGETSAPWTALMDDGDIAAVAPGAMGAPSAASLPQRSCSDCTGDPLAFWMFDDCNAASTELQDSATSSFAPTTGVPISHPAFRAVSVACVASNDGEGVQLSGPDDIVYAPDQPDFVFSQGLTIAAWINPVAVTGTQTIARKRLNGTSSFTLAIDNKQLTFVVRLTSGRLVGVTAPVKAGRFTHVAGTYDGKQVLLYLNGVLAAKTKAAGTIAPGVGPIFVGNDANGRQFKGIVDDVWLNTLAATPDEVMGLTCIRKAPIVSLSPAQTPPEPAGQTVPFTLSVTNPSSASCPPDGFELSGFVPFPLETDTNFGSLTVGPGQTAQATINVTALDQGVYGPVTFHYTVYDTANFAISATATATYAVVPGTGAGGVRPLVISAATRTKRTTTWSVNYWTWMPTAGDSVAGTEALVGPLAPAVLRVGGYNNDANTPDPFDDGQLDRAVTYARAIGAEPLIQVPLLADTDELPPTAGEAAAMVTYANVTKGYGIKYFSIGNEPDLYDTQGALTDPTQPAIPGYLPADYCASAKTYVAAMKAVDPTIQIVGPDLSFKYQAGNGTYDWLTPILQTCGSLFDIISIHRYPFEALQANLTAAEADLANFRSVIASVRGILTATGQGAKPLALTEMNVAYDATTCVLDASPGTVGSALWLADSVGTAIELGLWTTAVWNISDPPPYAFGLIDTTGTPRPEYYAYQFYADHFGPTVLTVPSVPAGVTAHASRNQADDATEVIVANWNTTAAGLEFQVTGLATAPAKTTYILPAVSIAAVEIPDNGAASAWTYGEAQRQSASGAQMLIPGVAGGVGGASGAGGGGPAGLTVGTNCGNAGGGPDVSYTFDTDTQEWIINNYADPNSTNLGSTVPDGGSAPTLALSTTDGSPNPGSLQVTVDFTALDQYVNPIVTLAQPGVSPSNKVLHAMIRLVSGSIPSGGVQFEALSGPSYLYGAGAFVAGTDLSLGTWVPLTLDLTAITTAGFDPTQIVQIGIDIFSGFSSNGGTFTNTGPAVFEIDTVTD